MLVLIVITIGSRALPPKKHLPLTGYTHTGSPRMIGPSWATLTLVRSGLEKSSCTEGPIGSKTEEVNGVEGQNFLFTLRCLRTKDATQLHDPRARRLFSGKMSIDDA